MNHIVCILDACSIINLIHIDEDDYLIKRLNNNIEYYLCQKVFREVNKNVYNRINNLSKERRIKKNELNNKRDEINKILNVFRRNQKHDSEMKHELGDGFFDEVQELTNYSKKNGEFYSTALALYLSRFKLIKNSQSDFVSTKVFFHTDDYPAKNDFKSFFLYQQIGYIEDTADLLLLLFRLDDSFNKTQLDRFLSNLFSEYAPEVSSLEKRLRELKAELSISLRKDRNFTYNLNQLIDKLSLFDFKGINENADFFFNQRKKYSSVCKLISKHESVFELDTDSMSLLKKIQLYRNKIEDIYRV